MTDTTVGHEWRDHMTDNSKRLCEILLLTAATLGAVDVLTGCGTLCVGSDSTIHVNAPHGGILTLDGMPTHRGLVHVDGHRRHVFEYRSDADNLLGSCDVLPHVSGGAVAGDVVLSLFFILPGVIAFVVDASTGGWMTTDDMDCSFTDRRRKGSSDSEDDEQTGNSAGCITGPNGWVCTQQDGTVIKEKKIKDGCTVVANGETICEHQ